MEMAGIRAAAWVLGKALSPLSDGMLEVWGASSMLGSNMGDLKQELLVAKAILQNVQGREIDNPALAQLLDQLRQLAYQADDVLDELGYFRIQDELDDTYHAANAHAAGAGSVKDIALNARHMAKTCLNKLKFPAVWSRAARRNDPDEQDNSGKQGILACLPFCGGRHDIRSSSQSPANLPCNVGKPFSCLSCLPSANHDAPTAVVENANLTKENEPLQVPKLKFDRVQMSRKILDIIEQLKPVCASVSNILSSVLQTSSCNPPQDIAMNRPETTPQIIEPKLYGRGKHKKIAVDEIVYSEFRELTVLPIVGMGGIGKTTFTQHVYEDMKSHFQVPIWICASQDFNANRLIKNIVKKIPEVNNEHKTWSDEELIRHRLEGKRVLLVLDDVWQHDENEWKKIITLFKKDGAKGNMVIVTTRIPVVANAVMTTKYPLELERLCSEDIMSFFEECVFGNQEPWVGHQELFTIGREIVDKLKGSPLAAKTVGRLLRNKLKLNHWRNVLESKEWQSETDKNDIMPALKLSYNYLPFDLQRCFSFCALFPEDYEFGSEELVHFWAGLDILHSPGYNRQRTEDVGSCYLDDLVNHGFLKMNKTEYGRPYYVLHDLLHELALEVSSYECLSIHSSNMMHIRVPPSVRHLSIIIDNTDVMDRLSFEECAGNLSALDKRLKVEHMRTLMLFGEYHGSFAKTFGGLFRKATALRTIFLSEASYNLEDILYNFSKLVHLRYLRIKPVSYCPLSLPSALFRLYHLEVIDLQSVEQCVSSTRHMSNLVKLRHFLVPENNLLFHSDIHGVGKLKFLQELREFRVGKESNGFELSQLGPLEIGGSLAIYNLENVETKVEANELKLKHKSHLRELILEWDVKRSNKDPVKEENVLGSLVPHSNLQELCIRGHGGTDGPAWLCTNLSVNCLVSLCLDGVSWKNLPPLGEMWMVDELGAECPGCSSSPLGFHNLKKLELSNISRLKKWVGNGKCPLFSHLEVLIIKNCSELTELPFSHPPTCGQTQQEEKMRWFPELRDLVIIRCPKLESLPPIPWRTGAPWSVDVVSAGPSFRELVYPEKFSSKLSLHIVRNRGWSGLNFHNLTDLQGLHMVNIPPLPLADFQVLVSLKRIVIKGVRSFLLPVEGVGRGKYRFPVEDLKIMFCDTTSGKELTLLLSFFPSLSKLAIGHCKNITGLTLVEDAETVCGEQQIQTRIGEEEIITSAAAEGLLLLPPHLEELSISNCPKVRLLLSNPLHPAAAAAAAAAAGGLQVLRSLRKLKIFACPEFLSSYSSSSYFPFPACLQDLSLEHMHMQTLQCLSNLTSLTKLYFNELGGSGGEGLWPLLTNGRLTSIGIHGNDGRLTSLRILGSDFFGGSDPSPSRPHDKYVFSRSSRRLDLVTNINSGFLDGPICSLFSSTLTRLDLRLMDEVERFTKEQEEALQLLISLQELEFQFGCKLQYLPTGLHKLNNLKKLLVRSCDAFQSLPCLPSSLQELHIIGCDAIRSLPDSLPSSLKILRIVLCNGIKSLPNSLPNSLEILSISRCNAIESLPKDGLPSSIRELNLQEPISIKSRNVRQRFKGIHRSNNEELKRECRKLIGTIPIVRI